MNITAMKLHHGPAQAVGVLISGVMLALCLSGWNVPWAGWMALAPLYLSLWNVTWKRALGIGFAVGIIRAVISWYWLAPTLRLMTGGWALSAVMYGVLCLLLGLAFAGYAGLHVRLCRGFRTPSGHMGRIGLMLAGAALWVAFEFIMDTINERCSLVFISNIGFSQWSFPANIQIAAWTGIYGISFVLAVWGLAWAILVRERDVMPLVVAGVIMAICLAYGSLRLMMKDNQASASMRVAILQGNVDPYEKLNQHQGRYFAERYFKLCREANAAQANLIVWSEGAVPWSVEEGDPFLEKALNLTSPSGAAHLVGMWLSAAKTNTNKVYNAALLVLADGRIVDVYRKNVLLPFAERPVKFCGINLSAAPKGAPVKYESGNGRHLLSSPAGKLAVTLCNESLYAGAARAWAVMGAEYMVNMGNDAWTPQEWALRQHFAVNVVRAVEVGLGYVIANNCGISGIVDRYGIVQMRSAPRTNICLAGTVNASANPTFYARSGNVFVVICMLVALVCLIVSKVKI